MGKVRTTSLSFLSVSIHVHPWLRKFVLSAQLMLGGTFLVPLAFAAPPDIVSISPLAVRRGGAVEVTVSGRDFDKRAQLWTSFPARVEPLGEASSSQARFRITAEAASPGVRGALRVLGSNGVSNPVIVWLDDLPGVAESNTNQTRAMAQPVQFNSAVDGGCAELGYDWFKLRVEKGQRVAVEIVAARIGSKLDSVVRVLNTLGRELAYNDDGPGLRGDSFVAFTASVAGNYFIEVRDVNYSGGAEFFYRLRVGDFPAPLPMFPLATGPGNNLREVTESEPNDTMAKAIKISLPAGINGRFNEPGDRDCYEFDARQAERLEFRAATRSLGSPCDAVLRLESSDGKVLARSNPSAADEGVVTHTFGSAGTARLFVEEATGAFGSNCIYRITTQRPAGFSLTLDTDRVNVAPGKTFDLKVSIARSDYKGAVTLALDGLREGVVLTNNVIGDGKSNTTMQVTVLNSAVPATFRPFSVQGIVKRNGEEVRVRASTAPALRRKFPRLLYPPPELDGELVLGVSAPN